MQLKLCYFPKKKISINKHFLSFCFFSFKFAIISGEYTELPRTKPKIADINNTKYRVGDALYGNCTSYNSRPAANLTWLINNVTVSVFV